MRFRLVGLAVVLGSSAACADEMVRSPAFEVRDSAGVQIAVSSRPRHADTIRFDEDPVVAIPGDFGAPHFFLDQVEHVVGRTPRGLVVGNGGSRELFLFDDHGDFERAVGGPGEGPGELQSLYGLAPCGPGRIMVTEVQRLSVFRDDGTFETTVPIVGHLAEGRASPVAGNPECTAALMFEGTSRMPVPGENVADLAGTLYWANFASGVRDTVVTFTMGQAQAWEFRGNLGWSSFPYSRRAVWTTDGRRVIVGRGHAPELDLHDGSQVISRVRWNAARSTLLSSDWTAFERSYAQFLAENPEERDFVPDVEFFHRPDERPPYSAIELGPKGRIWLQHYGAYGPFAAAPSPHWTVLTEDGEWLAEVELPAGFELLVIGASVVVGSARDAFDVQELRAYPIPPVLIDP